MYVLQKLLGAIFDVLVRYLHLLCKNQQINIEINIYFFKLSIK